MRGYLRNANYAKICTARKYLSSQYTHRCIDLYIWVFEWGGGAYFHKRGIFVCHEFFFFLIIHIMRNNNQRWRYESDVGKQSP